MQPRRSKISVPNVRHALPDDVQAEFENLLGEDDFSGMMEGPAADAVKESTGGWSTSSRLWF